ncbi:MAG: hypothetical protein U1F83_18980 [Verrucomicrobiota bacterium]
MSINPETDLDLEKLFLPAWAQGTSDTNRYAKYTGSEEPRREDRGRGDRRGPRPPRREGGERREFGRGPGGPRRDGPGGRPQRDDRGGPRRDDRRDDRRGFNDRRETPPPLPEITAMLVPDEKGVESMSRQVKMTGRAFPLFDIAFLVIQKPERYSIRFASKKNAEGQPVQPLFLCALDDTLWLSEDEAVAHVLSRHFTTFYQAEKMATEPPKGVYTFVGQCGLSGVVLGPPNHHDYQNQLRKLHTERFSRMPFEVFKSRVKIVRDEAVVKQWVEEQSWKTEYTCLNVPEPLKLPNREEVEKHFRATHKDAIIKTVESQVVSGVACRSLRGGLGRIVQHLLDDQRRFPMQIATSLSQSFAHQGLQFFKVNKTVTHVAVARPHFLDLETTPVSDGVKRIVEFINAHPKCNRRKLIEALAPSPAPAPIPVVPAAEGETAGAAPAVTPATAEPTPEQTALIADLHWLVHQGHVIEFANGQLDTAKKPIPRPPKPEAKPSAKPATPATDATEAAVAPVETTSSEVANAAAEPLPEVATTPTPELNDVAPAPDAAANGNP